MAYENVRLEEGKEKIVIVDGREEKIKAITIDSDTGNFMFKYFVDRDSPGHEIFEIVINGIVVDLYFFTHYEKATDTKIWTLEGYFQNGNIDKETIFEEVGKAVEVYGYHGFTNEMNKVFIERFGHDGNGKGRLDLGRVSEIRNG